MTFFFWSSFDFAILGGKLDVGKCDDLFFSLHLILGRHAVRFYGSFETASKLLGFGRLALVKKHCVNM